MSARPVAEMTSRGSPRSPRLVAVDVDGTLLTSDHRITGPTHEAVARIRATGSEVVLASSRPPLALEPILRRLGLVEPTAFIASQGAVTGTARMGGGLQIQHRDSMPLLAARAFVRETVAAGWTVSWFTTNTWFVSRLDDDVRREAEAVGLDPVVRDLTGVDDPPDKLMLMSVPLHLTASEVVGPDLAATLQALDSSPGYVEITRKGVDKSTALRRLCESGHVDASSVAVIGDGPNDLALFEFAGLSIATANARPEVLQAADFVTASNDDDGVAIALNALMGFPAESRLP